MVDKDVRLESRSIARAVIFGLNEGGTDAMDIGLCGTEEADLQTFHPQPVDPHMAETEALIRSV